MSEKSAVAPAHIYPAHIFPAMATPTIAIEGEDKFFPVRRIFCVGKNYADHVKEMGGDAKADPPVFFTKPADAVVASGSVVAFPPGTENLHFEGEYVLAIGMAGQHIQSTDAMAHVFGAASGCDLTRRDLQAAAKKAGAPWDMAKAFDQSAPIGAITRRLPSPNARLVTRVNGEIRQDARLSEMIWSPADIIASLSALVALAPGDLIFTGTPAGVGPLKRGDKIEVEVENMPTLECNMSL